MTVFLFITITLLCANAFVEKGGVMDKALTNESDPNFLMDKKLQEEFPSSQKLAFIYRGRDRTGLQSPADLLEYARLSRAIEAFD
jgi:hypothetical protein